ncbi:MAG: four helix bundle protein [Dehalococcoidia bacterium]|nr:four helix bundle protein [Dehalococcoidia bacterium]
MAVARFVDLVAWQKARVLTADLDKPERRTPFAHDHALAGQVQPASVSTVANNAEGFERNRPGEFHRFLSSCAEVRSRLYVALDAGILSQAEFNALQQRAQEAGRMLGALRSSVAARRDAASTQHSAPSLQRS